MEPRESRLWPFVAAVLLLPLLVLWHNTNALYSPLWYADPWFYLGYFRDLVEYKRDLFYGYYYGGRLAWLLPGFLIHSLFSPVAANLILHLTVQSTATLSFFTILRLTAGVRSAFLATLVFAVYPWLWVSTGWDYPGGAGIAYSLLAMALLTHSAAKPSVKWSLIAAGAAIAGMVYTHLFLATLVPLFALYYAALVWAWRRESLGPSLALLIWAGLGFGIVTATLSGINYLIEGDIWFYASSMQRARSMANDFQFTTSIWKQQQLAPWLWPGVIGCITAIALLPARLKKPVVPAALALSAVLLLASAYMLYLQIRGTTVLGHYPYANYLLPFVFLVAGISYWSAAETTSLRVYLVICCFAGIIFAALWFNPYGTFVPASPASQRMVMVSGALALGLALVFRRQVAGTLLAIAGFAAFSTLALAQTVNLGGVDLHGTREQYERIMRARDRIEAVRQGRVVRFWFDKQEPNFHEYAGLNALYIEEFSQLGTAFPQGCDVPVDPNSVIVVLSQKKYAAELARSALSDCWRSSAMYPLTVAVETVPRSDRPYTMALLLAQTRPYAPAPPDQLVQSVALDRVLLGDKKASLAQTPEGLAVTTLPGFGAFAGRVNLGLDARVRSKLAVHVWARVLRGKVGFGILNPEGKSFLVSRSMTPSSEAMEMVLLLPSPPVIGDLIFSNTAPGNVTSKAIIDKIEVRKMP